MGPLGIAILGGASVLALDRLYDWWKEPKALNPKNLPLVPGGTPGEVSLLDSGRTYNVRVYMNLVEFAKQAGLQPTWGSADPEGAGRWIALQFEKAGFKMLSSPVLLQDDDEGGWFTFNAKWTRSDRVVNLPADISKILPRATFTLLPVA